MSAAPPTPTYIFRGHEDQISSLEFQQNNTKLISGDAEGNIIIWDMKTKRPISKFKAHKEGILRCLILNDKLLSHGRDNTLKVWKINWDNDKPEEKIVEIKDDRNENDEHIDSDELSPKLEKSLPVNSLNFCKFDCCFKGEDVLIAVPSSKESTSIDVWSLSSQQRIITSMGFDENQKMGYCMAIKIFQHPIIKSKFLLLVAYENGGVILWLLTSSEFNNDNELFSSEQLWSIKEHKETALALDISTNRKFAISTAGDNKIVKYNFNENLEKEPLIHSITVKYAGIADIKIRSDSKIFATAGWDSEIRVFSSKTMNPLAILSYHKESVYSLAFACIFPKEDNDISNETQRHFLVGGGKDHRISLWEIY